MLVTEAINLIVSSNGTLRINELSQRLYISQSPLEKRFRKIVGATPKKFSSIIRINSVINNPVPNNSLTELGYASGYFDQSHFIKDFKTFTGQTPEQFFSTDTR
jgi:methylphosphotriester-DNA--protein-cysteine methyltransferase